MRKLWILCFTLGIANTPAAALNTYKDWNGTKAVRSFGCPELSTFGQTITIPKGRTILIQFSFWWRNDSSNLGSMVVRGEVYAWDGSKATGTPLWESEPRTISYQDDSFHGEVFETGGVAVTPGAKYVLFASIDKDYQQCMNDYRLDWGVVRGGKYRGGDFVFQDNDGDWQNWTSTPWMKETIIKLDVTFKAKLGP
jgi:hypothetical protein